MKLNPKLSGVLFALLLSMNVHSQDVCELGLSVGVLFPNFRHTETGTNLTTPLTLGSRTVLSITCPISERIGLTTGLGRFYFEEGYKFDNLNMIMVGSVWTYTIPVQVSYQLVSKSKFRVVYTSGVWFHENNKYEFFKTREGEHFTTLDSGEPGDHVAYSSLSVYNFRRIFPLIEQGVRIDFALFHRWLFSIKAGYDFGLYKIAEINVDYQYNMGPDESALIETKGGNLNFSIGLRYKVRR
ncbi:MAG: hypothetical protein JXQ90_17440 [Cyclobacteriaceae bacterium]